MCILAQGGGGGGLYDGDAHVMSLTSSSFPTKSDHCVYLVEFYAPWCVLSASPLQKANSRHIYKCYAHVTRQLSYPKAAHRLSHRQFYALVSPALAVPRLHHASRLPVLRQQKCDAGLSSKVPLPSGPVACWSSSVAFSQAKGAELILFCLSKVYACWTGRCETFLRVCDLLCSAGVGTASSCHPSGPKQPVP